MLQLKFNGKWVYAEDQSTIDTLRHGNIGSLEDGIYKIENEEALYLMDVRNASCDFNGKEITLSDMARIFSGGKKFVARYFTYKDWRDRGLIAKSPNFDYKTPNKTPLKRYPSSSIELPKYKLNGIFFASDLLVILEDKEKGKELYENQWFGQYGSYKAADRGQLNKLDVFEALYLIESKILQLKNATKRELIEKAKARHTDFMKLYEVYKDWRTNGYVVKTGFKFGTHFRIYFPGARPIKDDNWVHSKHVIHVFPKNSKLLISEWARAVRVAHSVRKTFILAIPGKLKASGSPIDFILYHRHGGEADMPANNPPRYAMLSLSEEEYIGGRELAGAIKSAKDKRLELMLAIMDRETAVTYYRIRQIELLGSNHEYYEIDWIQP
ncbi:MAG: tRNA-intron lyase [Candidatus Micrarchaeia archaeon]